MGRIFPLRIFSKTPHFDFMGVKSIAFGFSILCMVASIALLFTKGLNFGIDFSGGIVIEARSANKIDLAEVRSALSKQSLGSVELQYFGSENDIMVRLQRQEGDEAAQTKAVDTVKSTLQAVLKSAPEYRKVDYVGPQVGDELIRAGALSLLLSFAAIMLYIWLRFEWQFGAGVIAALIHDAIVTIGFYIVTGLEFNLTSVAAVLTVVGYSVNDSVVIYDRIRENLRKYKKMPVSELINTSINETLARTLLTVGTTLSALLALIFFGGDVLYGFSVAVFFGIAAGTYSSIYISAPILIFMKLRKEVS